MAMGRMSEEPVQGELFVTSADLPRSPGHVFYEKLDGLLGEAGFDRHVEAECEPHYDDGSRGGRPSIPPGIYFRMLFIGYFEGIDSQRGIAWRCSDSLSLRSFLGLAWNEPSPDHSSLTKIRKRLPAAVHEAVFEWVLKLCAERKLLTDPSTVGVDSTTLEANAALRSIVRKDTGAGYHDYVRGLMREEGEASGKAPPPSVPPSPPAHEPPLPPVVSASPELAVPPVPSLEEVIRFDRKRTGKKLSNADWTSPKDPDARIAKMKDGRTRLAYKAEHVVDLDSEVILAVAVYAADHSDHDTLTDSVMEARLRLEGAGLGAMGIKSAAADKGYNNGEQLELAEHFGVRTYVAEPERKGRRKWKGVPAGQRKAAEGNRRRAKGDRAKALQRRRSEVVERSFAHVCETGGSRRSWLCGMGKVMKRYAMAAAGRNLGLLMRKLFGIGKPRVLQAGGAAEGDGGGPEGGREGSVGGPEGLLRALLGRLRSLSALMRGPGGRREGYCVFMAG